MLLQTTAGHFSLLKKFSVTEGHKVNVIEKNYNVSVLTYAKGFNCIGVVHSSREVGLVCISENTVSNLVVMAS